MARYSDEIIDDVRQSNDIVDVISQYVRLKRSGRNYFGLCPFHNEKSPSFSVSPEKQIFHCFGCGVGGNVFTFLTKIEGINFVEAVQLLAERANIQLPTEINYVKTPEEALKEANVCFIFTEWNEIKSLRPEVYKNLMKTPLVYDGRNIYNLEEMKEEGVEYYSIGR